MPPKPGLCRHRLVCPLLLLALLLGSCAPLDEQDDSDQATLTPPEIPFTRHVLDNGLVLIVHEDHRSPLAAVNLWYRVGSRDENEGERGFAHLFEHLMYLGSEHHDQDFFATLEELGATSMNATTSRDRTNYFQNVPVTALERVLWLESDRMAHFTGALTRERADTEIGVVENEKRQRANRPYGEVYTSILRYSYPPEHPYHWPTIGSLADLNNASMEDLHDWHQRFYGAANAVLVVAGAVDTDTVIEQVEHYFGHIRSGPSVDRLAQWVARMNEPRRKQLREDVPQARIYRSWNVPGWGSAESDWLSLGAWVLGGSRDSRLHRRLVREDQLATSVSAFVSTGELGSQFMVVATAREDADINTLEQTMNQEISRLVRRGPTEEEITRARTAGYANFVRGMERIGGFGGKSDLLAMSEVYGGDPASWRDGLERYITASRGQVLHSLRQWIDDNSLTVVVQPHAPHPASEDPVDRARLPEVDAPPDLELPPVERAQLNNGLEIRLARRPDTPLIEARLILEGGHAREASRPGLPSLALGMLSEGTRQSSALELAARQENLGASIGASAGLDTATLSLSALQARLDESMALFAEMVRQPAFPSGEFERRRQQRLARIDQERSEPSAMASRVLPPLLYGEDHPYAQPFSGSGTRTSIEALDQDDLFDYHRRWFRPEGATLVVVGDITMEQLRQRVEQYFGDWRGEGEAPEITLPEPHQLTADKPRIFLLDRPGSRQGLVLAGAIAPPRSDPDDIALRAANAVLGGGFTARLNRNLREQRGWSYGVRSSLGGARGERPFLISAPVTPEHTGESMREIRAELEALQTRARPLSEEELARVVNRLTRQLPGHHETTAQIAGSLATIAIHGLDDDYYDQFISATRALEPDVVMQAANRLGQPDTLVWVVVGDAESLQPQLEALDWGDVNLLEVE